MYKADLIKLIKSLESTEQAAEKKASLFQHLNEFISSEAIRKLKDDSDIPVSAFIKFLVDKYPKSARQFFTQEYLKKGSPDALVLNKFIELELQKAHTEGPITSAAPDVRKLVGKYLSPEDTKSLGNTSKTLFDETIGYEVWRDKLIAAGCPADALSELYKMNLVKNYRKFYDDFIKLRIMKKHTFRSRISLNDLILLTGDIAMGKEYLDSSKESPHSTALSILFYAALCGNIDAMRFASSTIQYESSYILNLIDKSGRTALHYAALSGNLNAINTACEIIADAQAKSKFIINEFYQFRDWYGLNALHYAAQSGSADAMHALLKLGLDPMAVDKEGRNALHYAAKSGSVEAMKTALEFGIDSMSVDEQGRNVFHYAAESGNVDAMQAALKLGLDPQYEDRRGQTALHYAAKSGSTAAFQAALDTHIGPLPVNSEGKNLLHFAAESGSIESISMALALGIDPSSVDNDGRNALYYAAKAGKPDAFRALLEIGLNPINSDHPDRSILYYLQGDCNFEALMLIAKLKPEVFNRPDNMNSLIHNIKAGILQRQSPDIVTDDELVPRDTIYKIICFYRRWAYENKIDLPESITRRDWSRTVCRALDTPIQDIPSIKEQLDQLDNQLSTKRLQRTTDVPEKSSTEITPTPTKSGHKKKETKTHEINEADAFIDLLNQVIHNTDYWSKQGATFLGSMPALTQLFQITPATKIPDSINIYQSILSDPTLGQQHKIMQMMAVADAKLSEYTKRTKDSPNQPSPLLRELHNAVLSLDLKKLNTICNLMKPETKDEAKRISAPKPKS